MLIASFSCGKSLGFARCTVFLISSLQGVVAHLKSREKELDAMLREAETRSEVSQRITETIVAATPQGLMIFDHSGTLTIANQAAKNMLKVDTWIAQPCQNRKSGTCGQR